MIVALYIVGVLAVLFAVSGVLPRYRRWIKRADRVAEFEEQFVAYAELRERDLQAAPGYQRSSESDETLRLRAWLAARRNEMQRDAESVGKGAIYVAPPPMIGGGPYVRHVIFADLFDEQSYTDHPDSFRVDELATIRHEVDVSKAFRTGDLLNPWHWARLSFERVVKFPRYVLTLAGFHKAADGRATRIVTVVWSIVVGGSTIGAFVVGLIQLSHG
jgi:hypothetical protein